MSDGGIIIAAPASGSGKTLVSLGLMAALSRSGLAVASAKVGPDYIDPAFHQAASGRPGSTLDGWALPDKVLAARVANLSQGADLVICEGVMGLLDGADVESGPDGSTAQLAATTGWPVVLVVDAGRMAGSAAAVVAGFAGLDPDVRVAGVIFNRVASARHQSMILRAMLIHCPQVAVLGFLPHLAALSVPSRHLGLVQAMEHPDLTAFIGAAADLVADHVDLQGLRALAQRSALSGDDVCAVPPLGQRIAVAQDVAFAFAYADTLAEWRRQGAELFPFSPLADQFPGSDCDAVFLPGGYPELAAGQLAANHRFKAGMSSAAGRGVTIYGECGGYMVLGEALIDAQGVSHAMLGLLPVVTSLAQPRRHLGYRRAILQTSPPWGRKGQSFRGHEFHYAVELSRKGDDLFSAGPANGRDLCNAGISKDTISGSFIHLISSESI